MGAICGSVGVTDTELVQRMSGVLVHRGPDAAGYCHSDHTVLAARRLCLMGTEEGHQPVLNETRSVAVICDGTIYNYLSLRHELEQAGHTFTSHSEAEVLVHLYEEQ
jgi:asparagine synthase (glutamine-hydrolysing)